MGCVSSKGVKPPRPDIGAVETFQTNLVRNTSASGYELVYEQGQLLGEGVTGQVHEVTHRLTGKKFAMKSINLETMDKAQLDELRTEIMILKQLDHPNIVKLYEVYEDKEKGVIKLIMELLTGGHLGMRKMNEPVIRGAIKQIVSACRYFHSRGICHRDIKLENILWSSEGDDACVKVIDFGLGGQFYSKERLIHKQRMMLRRGSIATSLHAPEELEDRPIQGMDADDVELDLEDGAESASGRKRRFSGRKRNSGKYRGNDQEELIAVGENGSDKDVLGPLLSSTPKGTKTGILSSSGPSPAKIRSMENKIKKSRIFLTACGTAYYLPPEAVVATGKGYVGEKMDMWAVGVVTFLLIAKQPPFQGKDDRQVFECIRRCQPQYGPKWQEVSPEAKRFVQCCLVADPNIRYSAEAALESAWLKQAPQSVGGYVTDNAFRHDVVVSMRKFAGYSSLKKSAMMIVAHHQSDFQCIKLNALFHEIDTNNQGFITFQEFIHFLKEVSPDLPKANVRKIYKAVDQDRTSAVTYMEFLAASLEAEGPVSREMAMVAFSHLDQSRTGFVTHESLTKLLGMGFTNEEISGIIKEVDKTDSGRVSEEEFIKNMVENLRPSRAGSLLQVKTASGASSEDSEGDESGFVEIGEGCSSPISREVKKIFGSNDSEDVGSGFQTPEKIGKKGLESLPEAVINGETKSKEEPSSASSEQKSSNSSSGGDAGDEMELKSTGLVKGKANSAALDLGPDMAKKDDEAPGPSNDPVSIS